MYTGHFSFEGVVIGLASGATVGVLPRDSLYPVHFGKWYKPFVPEFRPRHGTRQYLTPCDRPAYLAHLAVGRGIKSPG